MFSLFQNFVKCSYLLTRLMLPVFNNNMILFTFQPLYYNHWVFNGTFYGMLGEITPCTQSSILNRILHHWKQWWLEIFCELVFRGSILIGRR